MCAGSTPWRMSAAATSVTNGPGPQTRHHAAGPGARRGEQPVVDAAGPSGPSGRLVARHGAVQREAADPGPAPRARRRRRTRRRTGRCRSRLSGAGSGCSRRSRITARIGAMPVPPATSSSGTRPAVGRHAEAAQRPVDRHRHAGERRRVAGRLTERALGPDQQLERPVRAGDGGEAIEYAARVLPPWRPAITACPARNANGPSSSSWTSRVRGVARRTDRDDGDHGRRVRAVWRRRRRSGCAASPCRSHVRQVTGGS